MVSVESICEQVSQLPQDQRFALVFRILSEVEPSGSVAIDALWDEEISARIARFDCGESGSQPAEEVFAEADRILRG